MNARSRKLGACIFQQTNKKNIIQEKESLQRSFRFSLIDKLTVTEAWGWLGTDDEDDDILSRRNRALIKEGRCVDRLLLKNASRVTYATTPCVEPSSLSKDEDDEQDECGS